MNCKPSHSVSLALLLLCVFGSSCGACQADGKVEDFRDLLDAIRFVESGNNPSPPKKDGGAARGKYQIHESFWLDSHTEGTYSQVDDPEYAEKVIVNYWKLYCPVACRTKNYKELSKFFHLGRTRANKTLDEKWQKDFDIYWEKVQKQLRK
jgi:hypothetical protein